MCIYLKTDDTIKVAEEDITVYKMLKADNSEFYTQYYAPFRNYRYGSLAEILNKTFVEELGTQVYYAITKATTAGLYSYKDYLYGCYYKGIGLFECIIPKGSLYYEDSGEYCSNQLKFVKKLKSS